jgi:hypothetical protein
MKDYSPWIYAFWILGTLLQFLACWAVVRKGYLQHWKAFAYYLFCMPAIAVPMIVISLWGMEGTYNVLYAVGAVLEAVLLSLVVLEIMVRVLEPFDSLPGKVIARFGFWAVLSIAMAVALSVVVRGQGGEFKQSIPLTVERTIFLVDAALLWILLLQSKSLGITWKSSVAEITIGFVLYLTVQATALFMIQLYSDNNLVVDIANAMGQFAYLISLSSWIWTMYHRDPIPPRPSPDAFIRMQELAGNYDAVPKDRIFAAVGIRINKPEPEQEEPQLEKVHRLDASSVRAVRSPRRPNPRQHEAECDEMQLPVDPPSR